MGMFDWIECDAALPDGFKAPRRELQSKDLDCELWVYRITEAGRLVRVGTECDGGSAIPHKDMEFHGLLNFYGSDDRAEPGSKWHEYMAKFTDGQLVEILTLADHNARYHSAPPSREGEA